MKKWGEIALGVVTSIGGFLEVGSIATSVQGGAEFGFRLAWALALGTICLAILMEMTGRLAAVSGRSYVDLLREHMGIRFFVIPLMAVLIVSFLVLVSEIGGVAISLQMATGIAFRWWAIPIALVAWALLWRGTFGIVEQGTALLGLVSHRLRRCSGKAASALERGRCWPAPHVSGTRQGEVLVHRRQHPRRVHQPVSVSLLFVRCARGRMDASSTST